MAEPGEQSAPFADRLSVFHPGQLGGLVRHAFDDRGRAISASVQHHKEAHVEVGASAGEGEVAPQRNLKASFFIIGRDDDKHPATVHGRRHQRDAGTRRRMT